MTDRLKDLLARMEAASAAMDFETAARLRDEYSLVRGAADPDAAADVDTTRLKRQQPGRMGLGTSEQVLRPPPGWTPPPKPDLMTTGASKRGRKRRG